KSRIVENGTVLDFIGFDQDPESLKVLQTDYGRAGITAIQGTVKSILAGKRRFSNMDLVYSSGLYDYLPEPVATRLTTRLFLMLSSGGKLVIANFTPDLPDSGYMETAMHWFLTYRTEADMERLIAGIPSFEVASIRFFRQSCENLVFVEIV